MNPSAGYTITNVLPACDPCSLQRRSAARSLGAEVAARRAQDSNYEPFVAGCALPETSMWVCHDQRAESGLFVSQVEGWALLQGNGLLPRGQAGG